jgi:nicotinamidase/pyrazinamidase
MKTVFFDVDTQLDFLSPAGALYVPGAEKIVKSLAELTAFAAANQIQIISTMDAHTEDDPEFKTWKPHCVVGTTGQQKAAGTLLNPRMVLADAHEAQNAPQIIVEKQKLDCFTNPKLRPLIDLLQADRFVVYGVASELCVKCAAFGLLQLGQRVELVTDAIRSLSAEDERDMIERFQAQGGRLTTVREIAA